MTSVLLIAVGLSIFFAVLKLADSIRDIAFELREARRAMEKGAAATQDLQRECWQALESRLDPPTARPRLEELLEDVSSPDDVAAADSAGR